MSRVLTIALAISCALAGCRKTGPPPRPPKPVTVATAETRDVPIYLDEIGNCTAYETVTIQPQVTGPIMEIHFTDGQEVKKGDLLFTIDPRPYQAALDKDRAKGLNDQIQLKRNEELRQTKVIAPQELDTSRAAAAASEAAVQTAQINLDYCSIRAPIDGRTSKRMVDRGNVVGPSTALLLIQRQDPIYVDFTVPESALTQVRKFVDAGTLKIQASFADDPSKSRVGAFDFLDSGVQPGAGTLRMRGVLNNEDRLFWPGQFVNVRILLDTLENAVLIPSEAMQVGNAGPFVFVVKQDNTVEMRPVKAGQRQDDDIVIRDGLKAGETVVLTGQITLSPGAPVTVVQEEKSIAQKQP